MGHDSGTFAHRGKKMDFQGPQGSWPPKGADSELQCLWEGVRVKGTVMLTTFFPWAGELSVPRHPARERRQCA